MYCEECKKRLATVHVTQLFNGAKVESHLCEECASKKGGFFFDLNNKFSIPHLLGSFFGNGYVQGITAPVQNIQCPNCGMNFMNIRETGKLGCNECYTVFEQELEPILRRIHGNSQHIGKIPSRGGAQVLIQKKIENLKARLQQAVAKEEYEKAAEIRDSIKELEKKLK
ncbi:MAG: UvrB/UvrC motif-containing protein [Syntrophomonadaceae bacterium]|jgi:protein arginine kinase activator